MSNSEASLKVVKELYEAVARGDGEAVMARVDENFYAASPPFALVLGRPYENRAEWMTHLIPRLASIFDFSTMKLGRMVADDDHVIVVVETNVWNSPEVVMMIEDWEVKNGKAVALRVYCWDTAPAEKKLAELAAAA